MSPTMKTTRARTNSRKSTTKTGAQGAYAAFSEMIGQAVGHAMGQATVVTAPDGTVTGTLRGVEIQGEWINGRSNVTVKTIGQDGKTRVRRITHNP